VNFVERRRAARFPFQAKTEIEWGSKVLMGSIGDISLTGMYVETPEPLWRGAQFSCVLLLDEPLRLDGEVRRIAPGQGMGVQFVGQNEEARARLEQLISSLTHP
jgi:hypothetical protein